MDGWTIHQMRFVTEHDERVYIFINHDERIISIRRYEKPQLFFLSELPDPESWGNTLP